jgi:processive 1,2-diacylglycerol beta-glucosyltransferase
MFISVITPVSKNADILILTAGFGEGHNSAALNLKRALATYNTHVPVHCADPCALGDPFLNKRIQNFYLRVTTHAPWLWRKIYLSTEKKDFSKDSIPFMRKPKEKLQELLEEFRPKVIVSTYPLYPYFLKHIPQGDQPKIPVITIVTDSIEINAAWRKAPTDYWLVTDQRTRESLIRQGLPETQIIETGFPVDPHFADLSPITADDDIEPFKILYFPTPKKPHVRRVSRELLESAGKNTTLTIVLGKNFRKLYSRAHEIKEAFPGRVTIKAWTKKVPELLNSHHLVVGKAGGATVHEALAAACPMLIHHLVPGQEEGNLNLLRHLNGGDLADTPGALASHLREMLADNASGWRNMKRSLARQARPSAAHTAANFILSQLK